MRIYVDDDDSVDRHLMALLKRDGHDVALPIEVGRQGDADPLHLARSIGDARVMLTANQADFENLHTLVLACGGSHPGIMVRCFDNDARRDMPYGVIARAVRNLERSGVAMANEVHVLNRWR